MDAIIKDVLADQATTGLSRPLSLDDMRHAFQILDDRANDWEGRQAEEKAIWQKIAHQMMNVGWSRAEVVAYLTMCGVLTEEEVPIL